MALGVTGFMKAAFGFRAAFFFTVFFAMRSPLEDAEASRRRVPRNGAPRAAITAPDARNRRLSPGLEQLSAAPYAALERADVLDRRLRDRSERLLGEERLMPGDQNVREGQEPGEEVILDDLGGEVLKEQPLF